MVSNFENIYVDIESLKLLLPNFLAQFSPIMWVATASTSFI